MYKFEQGAIILPLPMAEQSGSFDGGASDLLDPYEKLISLEIMGNEVSVPEKNRLLLSVPLDQYHLLRRLLLEW